MPGTIKRHGCPHMQDSRITALVISGSFAIRISYCSLLKHIMKQVIQRRRLNTLIWSVQEQEAQIILSFLLSQQLYNLISGKKFTQKDVLNWQWNNSVGLIWRVGEGLQM